MKFIAILALVLVAVSAKDYKFKQPKMPCAYKMTITDYYKGTKDGQYVCEFNGRYFKMKVSYEDYEVFMLARPDIGSDGNVTIFESEDDECYAEEIDLDTYAYVLAEYGSGLTGYFDDKTWDHKESKTWRDKKCDHYYDDEDEGIYVYDDHIYGWVDGKEEIVFEYEYSAPMKDFVLSKKDFPECVKKAKEVAETPSEDYIMCAASSLKVAFVAVLAALVCALF